MCPGFCGVLPLPSLDDFFSLKKQLLDFRIICWRLYATEPTLPVRDLVVGLGRCRVVGVQWYPAAMFSWDLIVATAKFPSQVVTNFSTFLASWRSPGYDSRKFLDVSIMLNRCFSGFLPCDTNCIWSDMTLSQVSAGPINQNSACFPTNGIHEAEESWARELANRDNLT